MTTKVLLDTDIGSDIDDAIALAYLLVQPDCDLLGISTVTGEADRRAMMASALCKLAGRSIPIFPGAETPLIIAQEQPRAPQASALDRWEHDTAFPRGEAVEFLRHTIRRHPGEVTLFGIGPLTNIALLFAADPEIPSLLKGLTLMCGNFTDLRHEFGTLEWNAKLDPHATTIVFRAHPPVHRSIGIDITSQVQMDAADVRARFTAKLLRPVLGFAEVWFRERPTITFHDPLAATTMFDDAICAFERGTVEVELEDRDTIGRTYWQPGGASSRHAVAVSVDKNRFFEHYFGMFEGQR
jgi:inosine-uridine nucleoside N-ribohydrolase